MIVCRAIRFPIDRYTVYSHPNVQALTLVLQDYTLSGFAFTYIGLIVCPRTMGEIQKLSNAAALGDSCVGLQHLADLCELTAFCLSFRLYRLCNDRIIP